MMLLYLICVGAVLQGDGNWLYDNWGSGSTLQTAVIIEISGLLFSIFFSVSSINIMCVYIDIMEGCIESVYVHCIMLMVLAMHAQVLHSIRLFFTH